MYHFETLSLHSPLYYTVLHAEMQVLFRELHNIYKGLDEAGVIILRKKTQYLPASQYEKIDTVSAGFSLTRGGVLCIMVVELPGTHEPDPGLLRGRLT